MNTPAHAIVNLALLGGGGPDLARARWVLAGSVLPDAPMFGFYAWQRFAEGHGEARIWGTLYFDSGWQMLFDSFHSIPVAASIGAIAWWLGGRGVAWLCASVALHAGVDLLMHHGDSHRHFLPISDWRFDSPISYWDPAHGGEIGALLEALSVAAGSALLFRRTHSVAWRALLACLTAAYAAAYCAFYLFRVFPLP